ncbi:MAG: HPF/RaiA family ribosome-associated protein [Steroidobacteraceae bacterium]
MQVLVSCDDPICCDENLFQRVEGVIAGTLERFSSRISRVEVQLRDVGGVKPGIRDKVCTLEAWMAAAGSVTASHEAATLTEAIHAAVSKLERLIAHELQQLDAELGSAEARPSMAPK